MTQRGGGTQARVIGPDACTADGHPVKQLALDYGARARVQLPVSLCTRSALLRRRWGHPTANAAAARSPHRIWRDRLQARMRSRAGRSAG